MTRECLSNDDVATILTALKRFGADLEESRITLSESPEARAQVLERKQATELLYRKVSHANVVLEPKLAESRTIDSPYTGGCK